MAQGGLYVLSRVNFHQYMSLVNFGYGLVFFLLLLSIIMFKSGDSLALCLVPITIQVVFIIMYQYFILLSINSRNITIMLQSWINFSYCFPICMVCYIICK